MLDFLGFCEYMPHKHCLADNILLMYGFTLSNVITVGQYFIIAVFLFYAATWGKKGGHWRGLCAASSLMFVFCSFNYIMQSIVIWSGCYFIQLVITWLGICASFVAVYHLVKMGKTTLGFLVGALKTTIKQSGF